MSSIPSAQSIADAANISAEALKSILDTALKATQNVFVLNGEYVRALSEDGGIFKTGLDFQEQMSAQTQLLERSGDYLRNVNDVCIRAQSEIVRQHTDCAGEVGKALVAQFDHLFQGFPMDGAKIAEMMKSAWSSASASYEKMIDTSRQITDSSLSAATNALQPAANAATTSNPSIRKSA